MMADKQFTPAEASRLLAAYRRFSAIPTEERSKAEQDLLANVDRHRPAIESVLSETEARYRGMMQGATLYGGDELYAAGAGMTPGGQDFSEALASQRLANEQSQAAYPEEYGSGATAGSLATSTLSAPLPMAALRNAGRGLQAASGAVYGAMIGAAPSYLAGEGNPFERIGQIDPLEASIGAGLGAAGPLASSLGDYAGRALRDIRRTVDDYDPRATRIAGRAVDKVERSGEDVREYLANLGPEGMPADVPGPPRAMGVGVTSQGGEGASALGRAVRTRKTGAEARIERIVDEVAGQPNAAFEEQLALAQEKRGLGADYDLATRSNSVFATSNLTNQIDRFLQDAEGSTRDALTNIKGMLTRQEGPVSAARLHNIRVEVASLQTAAHREGNGGVYNVTKHILDDIDRNLDTIPNYRNTRRSYANASEMERQLEAGRAALTGGPTTVQSPNALAAEFAKLSDAQKDAFRAGTREYIANVMGTSANAPASAWRTMSEKSFNRRKLTILFGSDEANRILRTLEAEKEFAQTYGGMFRATNTADKTAAQRELGPVADPDSQQRPGLVTRAQRGISEVGNRVLDDLLYGPGRSTSNRDIGRLMSLQGPERDRVVSALLSDAQARQKPVLGGLLGPSLDLALKASIPAFTKPDEGPR